jgi:mannose-1-phosphate guanylyltransferase
MPFLCPERIRRLLAQGNCIGRLFDFFFRSVHLWEVVACLILSAGFGTRLRPLTLEKPKPLLPVGDAPLLFQIQQHLRQTGLRSCFINTHHQASAFEELLPVAPLATTVIHEPTIRGTAGGAFAAHNQAPSEDLLVWNGDIWANVDVQAWMLSITDRTKSRDLAASWVLVPMPLGTGTVGVDAQGNVCRVREFRAGAEVQSGNFIGVQWLSEMFLRQVPEHGCLIQDALGPALTNGAKIHVQWHTGWWHDIGNPKAYLDANIHWLSVQKQSVFIGNNQQLIPETWNQVILGDDVQFQPNIELCQVVVWRGAAIQSSLKRAIVTSQGTIVPVP